MRRPSVGVEVGPRSLRQRGNEPVDVCLLFQEWPRRDAGKEEDSAREHARTVQHQAEGCPRQDWEHSEGIRCGEAFPHDEGDMRPMPPVRVGGQRGDPFRLEGRPEVRDGP
jgi:hypothetical protein